MGISLRMCCDEACMLLVKITMFGLVLVGALVGVYFKIDRPCFEQKKERRRLSFVRAWWRALSP